jgi:ATP-dependent RNA helicase DeaD
MQNENENTLPETEQPLLDEPELTTAEADFPLEETIELDSAPEAEVTEDEEATAAYVGSPLEDSGIDDNPDDIIEPDPPLPDYEFSQASDALRPIFEAQGWKAPMQVQRKAIPYMMAGQDLIVQSRTGSGKTGAFMIPLVEVIEPTHMSPQALVLIPTRELALQVGREAEILGAARGIKVVVLYGGVGYEKQLKQLKEGAQLVVGTPGRVIDLMQRGDFPVSSIRDLVLDEADEMLGMGFYPDMTRIRQMIPKDRCTYLFSATITENVKHLAREFLRAPKFLSLSHKKRSVDSISHRYILTDRARKDEAVLGILEHDHPEQAFIFCNTKRDVAYIGDFLRTHGLAAEGFSGDLSQAAREVVMAKFRTKEVRYLVTTDVAARGIDLSDIPCVIQYEQPADPDVYIHRAGRTARAGKTGVAWSVVSDLEEIGLKAIGRRFEIRFEKKPMFDRANLDNLFAERCVTILERSAREANRAGRRLAEKMLPAAKMVTESESLQLSLAMMLSRLYREEFYGQTGASLTGNETHQSGEREKTAGFGDRPPRRDGGGGRSGGRSGGHGGGDRGRRR